MAMGNDRVSATCVIYITKLHGKSKQQCTLIPSHRLSRMMFNANATGDDRHPCSARSPHRTSCSYTMRFITALVNCNVSSLDGFDSDVYCSVGVLVYTRGHEFFLLPPCRFIVGAVFLSPPHLVFRCRRSNWLSARRVACCEIFNAALRLS